MNKPIIIPAYSERQCIEWLAARGGVAVWTNKDRLDPHFGRQKLTPATQPDGTPYPAPHWNLGAKPDAVVTKAEDLAVNTWREVTRFEVRDSPSARGLSRLDQKKVDAALASAGPGARSLIDHTGKSAPWCTAVIEVPSTPRPLNPEIK